MTKSNGGKIMVSDVCYRMRLDMRHEEKLIIEVERAANDKAVDVRLDCNGGE